VVDFERVLGGSGGIAASAIVAIARVSDVLSCRATAVAGCAVIKAKMASLALRTELSVGKLFFYEPLAKVGIQGFRGNTQTFDTGRGGQAEKRCKGRQWLPVEQLV
jgi:hypothetical protein